MITRLGGSWGVPLWNGIVFGEPTEEFRAGLFIEEHVDELVRAIDDVDHQLFHFLIIEGGKHGATESSRMDS